VAYAAEALGAGRYVALKRVTLMDWKVVFCHSHGAAKTE